MYVPVDKRTAAWRLFHLRYQVRIPEILMYGPNYLKKIGYNLTGDKRVDAGVSSRMTTQNQTAAGIALLHAQGAPLDFVNRTDIAKVYNDIQEHLNDWYKVAYQGIHPDLTPPLEDFRMFEAVAMELYRAAKITQPVEPDIDTIKDRIMQLTRSRNPVFASMQARKKHMDGEGNLKPYESIVDKIEELILEG